jgi:hypothetical protein
MAVVPSAYPINWPYPVNATEVNGTVVTGPPFAVNQGGTGQTTAAAAQMALDTYGLFTPADLGILAWNYPSLWAAINSSALVSGTIYLAQIPLSGASITITNLIIGVYAAGSTLTASECWGGVYDNNGNEIGQTAQQATNWQSTGVKTMALASGPFTGTWPTVWAAIVSNGTTNPQLCRVAGAGISTPIINLNATGAAAPFAVNGTTQTVLPTGAAAFTYSSNNAAAGFSFWAGLS